MKKTITILSATTIILFFTNCGGNKTKDVCDCLKKAANTYMLQGTKPTNDDMYKMCNQFEDYLKTANVDEKRIVEQVIDTIKRHIEDKMLFTDVDKDIKFSDIPCGEDLQKDITRLSSNIDAPQAIEYYLKNRNFQCKIVVEGPTENINIKTLAGIPLSNEDPRYYIVREGNILINGYMYYNGNIDDKILITILIPEKEKENIKRSVCMNEIDETKNGSNDFEHNIYRQLIKFSGSYNEIVINGNGQARPVFKTTSYEIVSPSKENDKAEKYGRPSFLFEGLASKTNNSNINDEALKAAIQDSIEQAQKAQNQ